MQDEAKPIGTVIGNLREGYHAQDHARTPESKPSSPPDAFASSFEVAHNPQLKPMSKLEAAELVDRLLRNYPNLNAHDPQGYITALGEIMLAFPKWAGERAIVRMAEESPDFPPPGPRLRLTLKEIVSPWRFVAEWDARTREQFRKREERETRQNEDDPATSAPRGKIYSDYYEALAAAADGRSPFGAFSKERKLPYRG